MIECIVVQMCCVCMLGCMDLSFSFFFFLLFCRPPRSTQSRAPAACDVCKSDPPTHTHTPHTHGVCVCVCVCVMCVCVCGVCVHVCMCMCILASLTPPTGLARQAAMGSPHQPFQHSVPLCPPNTEFHPPTRGPS